jgi:hypothetical protein
VREQVAVPLRAQLTETGVGVDPGALLGPAHREPLGDPGEEPIPVVRGVEALHRGAGADPTRIPAEEVEARAQRGGEDVERLGQHHGARGTRAAGVEEECAEAVGGVGGRMADDGEVNGRALRVPIVQRHLGDGAVEA